VAQEEPRGCPFHNADAETPAGECQGLATKEYRDWVGHFFPELAADTGATDSKALADALIVLYNGALTTATTTEPARAAAMTAKRIARLTLAAAKASSSA
jgi:hypothetical protein